MYILLGLQYAQTTCYTYGFILQYLSTSPRSLYQMNPSRSETEAHPIKHVSCSVRLYGRTIVAIVLKLSLDLAIYRQLFQFIEILCLAEVFAMTFALLLFVLLRVGTSSWCQLANE